MTLCIASLLGFRSDGNYAVACRWDWDDGGAAVGGWAMMAAGGADTRSKDDVSARDPRVRLHQPQAYTLIDGDKIDDGISDWLGVGHSPPMDIFSPRRFSPWAFPAPHIFSFLILRHPNISPFPSSHYLLIERCISAMFFVLMGIHSGY